MQPHRMSGQRKAAAAGKRKGMAAPPQRKGTGNFAAAAEQSSTGLGRASPTNFANGSNFFVASAPSSTALPALDASSVLRSGWLPGNTSLSIS